MVRKVKTLSIGQRCHICGSDIKAVVFDVNGETSICEICRCSLNNDDNPSRTAAFSLDEYENGLKHRILSMQRVIAALKTDERITA